MSNSACKNRVERPGRLSASDQSRDETVSSEPNSHQQLSQDREASDGSQTADTVSTKAKQYVMDTAAATTPQQVGPRPGQYQKTGSAASTGEAEFEPTVGIAVGKLPGELQPSIISETVSDNAETLQRAVGGQAITSNSSIKNKPAVADTVPSYAKEDYEDDNRSVEKCSSTETKLQEVLIVSPKAEVTDHDGNGSMIPDSTGVSQPIPLAGRKVQAECVQTDCKITTGDFRQVQASKLSMQFALAADTLSQFAGSSSISLKSNHGTSSTLDNSMNQLAPTFQQVDQIELNRESVILTDNSGITRNKVSQPKQQSDDYSEMTEGNPNGANVLETIPQPVDTSTQAKILKCDSLGPTVLLVTENSTGKVSKTMQQTLSVVVLQAKTMEHSKEPGGIQLSKRFNMPPSTNGKCDRESITTCTVDCDSSHVENSNSASQSATVLLADNPPLVEPISSTLTARDDIQVSNSTVQGIVGAGTFPEAKNREEFTFSAKNIPKPSSVSPSVSPMKHDMGPMTTTEFVEIAKPSIQSMLMAGILPQSENTDGQLMPECDTFIGPGLEIPITKHAIGTFSQPEDVDASISSSSTEVTPQLVSALQSDNTWELNTGLVSVNYSSAAKTTAVTMASHTKTMKENDHSAITADGYLTDAFSILEVSPKSTCAFPVSSTPHGSESKNSTNLSKATHHLSQQVEGMKQENGSNKLVTKNSNSSTGASNIILSSQEVLENDCVMTIDSPNCTSSEVVHVTVSAQVKTTEQRDKSPMTVDGIQPSKVTVQSVAAGDIMSPQTKNYVKLDEELLRTNDTSSTCIEDFVSDQQPVCAAGKPPRAESMQKVMVVDDIKTTVQSAVVISTLSQSEDTNDICVTHPPSCIDAYPQDSDAGHGNQSVTLTDDFNSTEFSRIMEAQQPIVCCHK